VSEPLRLSYSQVATWLRCPKLYAYRYVEKAEPEKVGMALLLGGAVHDAIGAEAQRRLEGCPGGLDYALRSFREMLLCKVDHPEAPVDLGEKGLVEHLESGEGLVRAYFEHGPVGEVQAVEQDFEQDLGPGVRLAGVIDFVVRGEDGPEVVELKTSARSWSELQAEAVPVTYRVLVKTRAPKVQELRVEPDREWSSAVQQTVLEVAGGIRSGCFPRNPSPMTCAGCAYFRQCSSRGARAA
jgi:hypothetical protein